MESIDVFFELENARAHNDRHMALESLTSVLKSAENLRGKSSFVPRMFICRSPNFSAEFLGQVLHQQETFPSLTVEHVELQTDGYFGAKNAPLAHGEGRIIVFCDSDCLYSPDYLLTMVSSIEGKTETVVYGTTFAARGRTSFSEVSSLIWLFPPESVGYGKSWPNTKWANSLGLYRQTLERFPFPSTQSRFFRAREFKQERYIWEVETTKHGIDHLEVKAVAYHAQFKNLAGWLNREITAGLGIASRLRTSRMPLDQVSRISAQPLRDRIEQLKSEPPSVLAPSTLRRAMGALRLGVAVRWVTAVGVYLIRNQLRVDTRGNHGRENQTSTLVK